MVDNNPRIKTVMQLIDLKDKYTLAHFSSRHKEIIFETLEELGLSEIYDYHLFNYYICPVETAQRLTYNIPDNVILSSLNLSHVDEINDYITYKSPNTEKLIRQAISFGPSLGAFDKTTGQLMAWCLTYLNEAHSAMAVREEFRGKGLAKLLARKMAHDRAVNEQKLSHCHISGGRVISEHVFRDAGFEIVASCYFGGKGGIIV